MKMLRELEERLDLSSSYSVVKMVETSLGGEERKGNGNPIDD